MLGCVENNAAIPFAVKGLTMNKLLVAAFPFLIGAIFAARSNFCNALANASGCLLSFAPFASAMNSLLLLSASCSMVAISGVIIARTRRLIMFPAPSRSLPPPNIAAHLAMNAT